MTIPPMTDLDRSFCAVLLMARALEAETDRLAEAERRELEEAHAEALSDYENTETEVAS
jgi:hypothetical protein